MIKDIHQIVVSEVETISWKELIPESKYGAVERALYYVFGTDSLDSIERLSGGRSSSLVYKIVVDNRPYVLRVIMQVDMLNDPVRQYACMNIAASAGIAPPVRYSHAKDAVSIIDFIENIPLVQHCPIPEDRMRLLTKSIKSIHALPLFPPLVDFVDGVDGFIARFKTFDLLPEAATTKYFKAYAGVQQHYPRHSTDLVSSHNDLNPGNILCDNGRLWVIDWESSFANDRYVDLACVNIFSNSGESGEEVCLQTYFGYELNDYHRARYFVMKQVCFMYYAMMFMYMVSVTKREGEIFDSNMETISLPEFYRQWRIGEIQVITPAEHLYYAKILLNESLQEMTTPRFCASIDTLNRYADIA